MWKDLEAHRRALPARADMADIRGMDREREMLEACALTRQNMLMVGPPGIGKTMLARRLPTILPPLTEFQRKWLMIEYDAAGLGSRVDRYAPPNFDPPFRAPHHTVSPAALVGDGIRAGEAQLARFGVLFLDDVHEFHTGSALPRLAACLARMENVAPIVVATAIPCPCGWHETGERPCHCKPDAVSLHQKRLGMIAMSLFLTIQCEIRSVKLSEIRKEPNGEPSAAIRERVIAARNRDPEGVAS